MTEPLTPLEWTRRYGYLYPPSLFRAALRATFPPYTSLLPLTAVHEEFCVGEYEGANAEWNARVEAEG